MITSITQCQQQAISVAHAFRVGSSVKAQQELVPLIDALIKHFPQHEPRPLQVLLHLVKSVRECQERNDWLGLADYLEYELQDLLTAADIINTVTPPVH